jgi:hypothetical protein
MASPTMTTTVDGSSMYPQITATDTQMQFSSTSAPADEENFSISPTTPTLEERIVDVTADSSSFNLITITLDQRTTSTTLTVGNSKRRDDFGANLLSYYRRNVGVVVLAALSFMLLGVSVVAYAVVKYLIRRRLL